jgi:hypothetical protein
LVHWILSVREIPISSAHHELAAVDFAHRVRIARSVRSVIGAAVSPAPSEHRRRGWLHARTVARARACSPTGSCRRALRASDPGARTCCIRRGLGVLRRPVVARVSLPCRVVWVLAAAYYRRNDDQVRCDPLHTIHRVPAYHFSKGLVPM